MKLVKLAASLFVAILFLTLVGNTFAAATTFSASGANPAAVQATVDAFRLALGALNPNVVGSFPSGRREINWDGVPDAASSPNAFPANFFNSNSPRGVVFSTPGTGFQVSATAASGAGVRFDNINATYSITFQAFSQQKLFTSIGSNVTDVNFFVPGSAIQAFTSGFGAIFTDVDLANTTSLQFFDLQNNSLGTFFVPTANLGLSFLGIQFNAGEKVSRVRITSGDSPLGSSDNSLADVVVMDDFLFGEPQAAPEASSLMLTFAGVGLVVLMFRRRSVQA